VIRAADGDVEQVEALMEEDEEEQEKRSSLAEISANIRRVVRGQSSDCDAAGRGRG
jgi:hypothetical protein